MKVYTISKKLQKEWDRLNKSHTVRAKAFFDLLKKYGVTATKVEEGGNGWEGECPQWCMLKAGRVYPNLKFQRAKEFMRDYANLPKADSWFGHLLEYRVPTTHSAEFEVSTIGGKKYIVKHDGYDFSKAGCKLIDV